MIENKIESSLPWNLYKRESGNCEIFVMTHEAAQFGEHF